MPDNRKLEHFLDSLEISTHLPDHPPATVSEPARSLLDKKMDKYDLSRLIGQDYENAGTAEFPLLAPRSSSPWSNPMYMPQWANSAQPRSMFSVANSIFYRTYAGITGINLPSPDVPAQPVESPFDRLKSKVHRLAEVSPERIPNPAPPKRYVSPDFVHALTAWRAWSLKNGLLDALGTDHLWEPRCAPRAICVNDMGHDAPSADCYCGYWSFKSKDTLTEALRRYADTGAAPVVLGTVEIWGKVVECENGYRSEYAYPKELWLLGDDMEHLSWTYGVPVRKLG